MTLVLEETEISTRYHTNTFIKVQTYTEYELDRGTLHIILTLLWLLPYPIPQGGFKAQAPRILPYFSTILPTN